MRIIPEMEECRKARDGSEETRIIFEERYLGAKKILVDEEAFQTRTQLSIKILLLTKWVGLYIGTYVIQNTEIQSSTIIGINKASMSLSKTERSC